MGTRVGTRGAQPLSYDLRLPDAAQADALRLLDTSRAVINQALTALWPHLDAFLPVRSPREPTVALRGGGGRSV